MKTIKCTGMAVILCVLFLSGCDNAPTATEVGENTGSALNTAGEKTVEFTGKALDVTGEGLKKAGEAIENTGENMQE